jgi:uncharacterized alpha-E superfamily protein
VSAEGDGFTVSNQAGALSKDTWVLTSEPEKLTGFWLQSGPAVDAVTPEGSMSSRAAENLFWLGRYAERTEGITRLVRVVYDRRNDFGRGANPSGTACLHALLVALTRISTTYPGFVGDEAAALLDNPAPELTSLVLDTARPGSLAHGVRAMLDAAYAVRDQLSSDTWLVVAELERSLLGPVRPRTVGRGTLGRVLTSLLALSGVAAESMVRDPGWRFMDAGRRIERALQLTALLRATISIERDHATDSLLLESVLTAAESIITYRRRYRSQAQVETLLDLLLLDPDNPRSLAHQLGLLGADIDALPTSTPTSAQLSDAGRRVLEVSTSLRLVDTSRLAAVHSDGGGARPDLVAFLDRTSASLTAAAAAVAATHFRPRIPPQALLVPAAGV